MSFICGNCKTDQPDGVKPILIVTNKRTKKYPERYNNKGKLIDKGGTGYETVEEKQLCSNCVKEK